MVHCWLMFSLSTKISGSLSAKLLPSYRDPRLFWALWFLFQVQDLSLVFLKLFLLSHSSRQSRSLCRMAVHSDMSTLPPSLVSSVNPGKVPSIPLSRSFMKMFNNVGLSIDAYRETTYDRLPAWVKAFDHHLEFSQCNFLIRVTDHSTQSESWQFF